MKYDFWEEWEWCKGNHPCSICGFHHKVEHPSDVRVWLGKWLVADCSSCQSKGTVNVLRPVMPELSRFMVDLRKNGASRYFHVSQYMVGISILIFFLLILWGILTDLGYM